MTSPGRGPMLNAAERLLAAAAATRAVGLSVFGRMPADLQQLVLEDHRDVSVESGHRFMGRDQPAPHRTGLVVSGLLRMYVEAPDGRQINFRYASAGYFLGAAATVGGAPAHVSAGVEAVTPSRVLFLNQERLRALAHSEAAVGWALLEQMAAYQRDLLHMFAGTAFGSIRQRVAMHLLNLATSDVQDGASTSNVGNELSAPVTQQSLADAVGTTRRPVARALAELLDCGAIRTQRNRIVLLNPELLAAETQATGVSLEPEESPGELREA
jgi:CRP/FNR family transcriptional regulator, cyclic AMP receptor protein